MTALKFVELFAGAGGLSRGLEMAGWKCAGHAEWEDAPRSVLRRHWPDVPLWGDVSKLSGHDIVSEVGPFDMLTFGAPCQDFAIGGTRDGMSGERSVLVLDALRIWEQSGAPLALYENVPGMFSSNKGEDFAAILSEFVGSTVRVPSGGWKGGGGVARGSRGVAAWRVLDAQYHGVPQKRRRVFVLGSRNGRVDPAEILSLAEGMSGKPATRKQKKKAAAFSAEFVNGDTGGAVTSTGVKTYIVRNREGKPGGGKGPLVSEELSLTLGTSNDQVVYTVSTGTASTTQAEQVLHRMVAFGEYTVDGTASTLMSRNYKDYTELVVNVERSGEQIIRLSAPRRLTPRESERLMGWDTDWTAYGINEKLHPVELKNTPRYKACGNGVVSPVAAWVGFRIRAGLEGKPANHYEITDE
jgi:DNA (cytosine-5)-methyltransferase 1